MSKSLARVTQALAAAGMATNIHAMPQPTRTAAEAAAAAGVTLNQIVKSILLQGSGGQLYLFLTAGGNQIDPRAAASLTAQTPAGQTPAAQTPAGQTPTSQTPTSQTPTSQTLTRADADTIRRITGFAIGGVAPIGHLTPLPTWFDPTLLQFPVIWAAAGTPNHIFQIEPARLLTLTAATLAHFTAPNP